MNIGVILAGGIGSRMMRDIPKQFIDIEGKPLIVHTIEKFSNCESVDKILIVCLKEYIEHMQKICKQYNLLKIEWVVKGGATRHASIQCALDYLSNICKDDDLLILHNANMPLVSEQNIVSVIDVCEQMNDISTSVALCSGFFYEKKDDLLLIGPDRENIFSAKVPEALHYTLAKKIYNNQLFKNKKYESYTTGMLGLMHESNVIPVICESTNMKITTEDDFTLVSTYLNCKNGGEFNDKKI